MKGLIPKVFSKATALPDAGPVAGVRLLKLLALVFIFILITGGPSPAQDVRLLFQHLGVEHNLTQTTAPFIYTDSRGFTWMGSINGVFRFDGLRVEHYEVNPDKPGSLKDGLMQSDFFEDSRGDLWFSSHKHLYRYVRKTNAFETILPKGPDGAGIGSSFQVLHLERDTLLWLVADSDIYTFNTQSRTAVLIITTQGVRFGKALDDKGRLKRIIECPWVMGTGIGIIDLATKGSPVSRRVDTFDINGKPVSAEVSQALVDGDTTVWLCSNVGLLKINPLMPDRARRFEIPSEASRRIRNIVEINPKALLVSSSTGLWLFDKVSEKFIQNWRNDPASSKSIRQNQAQELYLDRNNTLWVSIYDKGIDYSPWHFNNFHNPFAALGASEMRVTGIAQDKRRRIWCNVLNEGIYIFNINGKLEKQFNAKQTSRREKLPGEVQYLYTDRNGEVWIIASRKLYQYDQDTELFKWVGELNESPEYAVAQAAGNRYFISAKNILYEVFYNNADKNYSVNRVQHQELASKGYLKLLPLNNENEIHIQADDTLKRFKLTSSGLVLAENFYFPHTVYSVCPTERDGGFLVSTADAGLLLLDDRKAELKPFGNNKSRSSFFGLIKGENPKIWAVSGANLMAMNASGEEKYYFQPEDGIEAGPFQLNASLLASDGKIWLGGAAGLAVFHPDSVIPYPFPPHPHVTSLLVNNVPYEGPPQISEADHIEFSYKENSMAFLITAVGHYFPHLSKIMYRLSGADNTWLTAENSAEIRYNQLAPGKYTLELMAVNANGIQSAVKALGIVIHPPFWQRWWFIALVILAAGAISFGIYSYRITQLKKEWELRQQTLASEMKALRAQMNPHFLFNSLNSINSFILSGKNEKAKTALDRFATLMRQILDNSAKETITLEKEVAFLENYLAVEATRFDKPFHWSVQVAEDIDTFETEIPSMITQPFVENAILHGIMHKPLGGHVFVTFSKEGNALLCSIKDNGIGRAAAAEYRSKQADKHQSMGMQITLERLALYDQKNGVQSSVQALDLADEEGKPAGTSILIKIGFAK